MGPATKAEGTTAANAEEDAAILARSATNKRAMLNDRGPCQGTPFELKDGYGKPRETPIERNFNPSRQYDRSRCLCRLCPGTLRDQRPPSPEPWPRPITAGTFLLKKNCVCLVVAFFNTPNRRRSFFFRTHVFWMGTAPFSKSCDLLLNTHRTCTNHDREESHLRGGFKHMQFLLWPAFPQYLN